MYQDDAIPSTAASAVPTAFQEVITDIQFKVLLDASVLPADCIEAPVTENPGEEDAYEAHPAAPACRTVLPPIEHASFTAESRVNRQVLPRLRQTRVLFRPARIALLPGGPGFEVSPCTTWLT